ncbi:MAG: Flp family type IVb pilin [Hyphomicrobium sp.]
MRSVISRFLKDEAGATSIEYAVIAVIVSVGIATSVRTIPTALGTVFATVGTSLN